MTLTTTDLLLEATDVSKTWRTVDWRTYTKARRARWFAVTL